MSLNTEEVEQGIQAVEAKLEKIVNYKRLYMKLNDHRRWGEADEEERMLRRLLAEYQVLRGEE